MDKYSMLNTMFASGPTIPYIFNLTTLMYPLMCKSAEKILGVPASDFMNYGVKTLFDKMHPQDVEIFTTTLFLTLKSCDFPNPGIK